jgi:hypothetical protein
MIFFVYYDFFKIALGGNLVGFLKVQGMIYTISYVENYVVHPYMLRVM